MSRAALHLHPARSTDAETKGALLSAEGVAKLFPAELGIDADWVRRHVGGKYKVGRMVFYYEGEVQDWISHQRVSA